MINYNIIKKLIFNNFDKTTFKNCYKYYVEVIKNKKELRKIKIKLKKLY